MHISKIDETITNIKKWSIAKHTHMWHWYNSGEYEKVLRIFEEAPHLRCIAYHNTNSSWLGNRETYEVAPVDIDKRFPNSGRWHETRHIRNDYGQQILNMSAYQGWVTLDFIGMEKLEPDVTEKRWYYYCFPNPKYHWLPMLRKQFLRKK